MKHKELDYSGNVKIKLGLLNKNQVTMCQTQIGINK